MCMHTHTHTHKQKLLNIAVDRIYVYILSISLPSKAEASRFLTGVDHFQGLGWFLGMCPPDHIS